MSQITEHKMNLTKKMTKMNGNAGWKRKRRGEKAKQPTQSAKVMPDLDNDKHTRHDEGCCKNWKNKDCMPGGGGELGP